MIVFCAYLHDNSDKVTLSYPMQVIPLSCLCFVYSNEFCDVQFHPVYTDLPQDNARTTILRLPHMHPASPSTPLTYKITVQISAPLHHLKYDRPCAFLDHDLPNPLAVKR